MATLKTCDRCGATFSEKEELLRLELSHNYIKNSLFTYKKKEAEECVFTRYRFTLEKVDLCADCLLSLTAWFEEDTQETHKS